MRAWLVAIGLGLVVTSAPASADASASRYVVVFKRNVSDVNAETNALEARLGFGSTFRYAHALKKS